jgi:hypothetical protein
MDIVLSPTDPDVIISGDADPELANLGSQSAFTL